MSILSDLNQAIITKFFHEFIDLYELLYLFAISTKNIKKGMRHLQ